MKTKIKLVLTTLAITLTPAVFAGNLVVCPTESSASSLFANNWEKTSRNYYISVIQTTVNNYHFSGALHTIDSNQPVDANPHLRFSKIVHEPLDPERGTRRIDCQYKIGNTSMTDLGDGLLHLIAEFPA